MTGRASATPDADMDLRAHWRGRERYTVFDTCYGDGARVRALQEAWRTDPERPGRLHIVALARLRTATRR